MSVLKRAKEWAGRLWKGVRTGASTFRGAGFDRLNLDWIMRPTSVDQEVKRNLRVLRDRARELERDNPFAARYVELCAENIIGPDGFQLQGDVKKGDGNPNTRINDILEEHWVDFCRPENFTLDGRLSMTDVETLVTKRWKGADGEALVEVVPGVGKYGVQLNPLDADLLDETFNRPRGPEGNEIRCGIEVDARGRPLGYWLWTTHPNDDAGIQRDRRFVAADHLFHVFTARRPGQARGITRFASILQPLKMLQGLEEAVLVAARTAACKMGFIEVDPEHAAHMEDDESPQGRVSMDAEPGLIEQLPKGMHFEGWDPSQPSSEYDPFTRNILRSVAAGLNVSYMALTGDLEGASYSSARVGLLAERRSWRRDQESLRDQFHDPLYRLWLKFALLTGALPLDGFNAEKYRDVVWLLPGWAWVDPQKDIESALMEADAGLNSLTAICASNGRDFEEVIRQRARENDLAASYGVTLRLDRKATPEPAAPPAGGAGSGNATTLRAPRIRLIRGS